MKRTLVLLTLGALAAGTAVADPPKTLRAAERVQIKASPDAVWAAVKDWDGLNKWHPGFSSDEIVSGGNGKVGSVRKLTIKDGPSFTEKLTAYDEAGHSYHYIIVESPLPITDYKSKIAVLPGKGDGMTEVVWSGTFKRKNTSDNPPEAESDAGALKLVKGVYRGGLDNLKKMLSN
jgi:mxaD protein